MNRERHLLPDVLSFKWFARHGFTARREKEWGRGKKGLCLHRSFYFQTAVAYNIQEWKERPLSALQSEDTPPQKHFAILYDILLPNFLTSHFLAPKIHNPTAISPTVYNNRKRIKRARHRRTLLPVDRGAPPLATIALCLAPAVLHYEPAVYLDLVRLCVGSESPAS